MDHGITRTILLAILGLVVGARKFRKASPPETLRVGGLIGFGVLGIVLMTVATLALIAAFYWGEPMPPPG